MLKKFNIKNEADLIMRTTPNNLFVALKRKNGRLVAWTSHGRPDFKLFTILNGYTLEKMVQPLLSVIRAYGMW